MTSPALNDQISEESHVAMRRSFEQNTGILGVMNGFLVSKLGRKIVVATPDSVTETYTYKDGSNTLFVLTVIYTDSTKATLVSVERTA